MGVIFLFIWRILEELEIFVKSGIGSLADSNRICYTIRGKCWEEAYMVDWRKQFKPWILTRGQEYFECGQVAILREDGAIAEAEVSGSNIYHVVVQRRGERVTSLSCDCPYASRGENCKHMVAVLIALEEESTAPRMDWQTALEQMPPPQLRELLRCLAAENGTLQDRIVRMVSGPGNTTSRWQADLNQIISDYTDYDDRVEYDQAYYCMAAIAEYLEECLPSLLNAEKVMDAAKLVMTVYETAFGLDVDDSDGGMSVVSHTCQEALKQILALADTQQERAIFYLLHSFLGENCTWVYGSSDLESLILSLDWSYELQQKHLDWLDENLDDWRMQQRAELMERMGATPQEVIAWWEQYRETDSAYRPLLRLYEENDLTKAVGLVREKRDQEKHTGWQLVEYTETLLRLLEKASEQGQYENELRYLVLNLKCQETEYVSRLKQVTSSGQWPHVFEVLLANAKHPSGRMRLYHFEGMYSELLTELVQYPSVSAFLNYEEDLRSWNPERTLKLYVELLKREMDVASDRKQYRHIVSHLHALKAYSGGQEAAKSLAAYWYAYHKNRPAMKDELRRAGYVE